MTAGRMMGGVMGLGKVRRVTQEGLAKALQGELDLYFFFGKKLTIVAQLMGFQVGRGLGFWVMGFGFWVKHPKT